MIPRPHASRCIGIIVAASILCGCQGHSPRQINAPPLIPDKLPNPRYATVIYVSVEPGMPNDLRIEDAHLASRLISRLTSIQWLQPTHEVNWACHLYLVICDVEGQPFLAAMSDQARSSLYLATPKGSQPPFRVASVQNQPWHGKAWAEQERPTAFRYAIPARDLILEI